MQLSVIIPAHNEEGCIRGTVEAIIETFQREQIPNEILVINDNSRDRTEEELRQLAQEYPGVRYLNNQPPNGIGNAIRKGLDNYSGDAVVIVMADGSDAPCDIVTYYRELQKGFSCAFGSRFIKGGHVCGYPFPKLLLNRLGNQFIKILFHLNYNDITNAFKCYRREVIESIKPITSAHFEITVELPLKAIAMDYSYNIVPISWKTRTSGVSKLRIREMGARYFCAIGRIYWEKKRYQNEKNKVGLESA
jgi:dolichol-phosphate mannosyltransferase